MQELESNIDRLTTTIADKQAKADKMLRELPKSIAIQRLCPTAFDKGAARSIWRTVPAMTVFEHNRRKAALANGSTKREDTLYYDAILTIKQADGTIVGEFAYDDVPSYLQC